MYCIDRISRQSSTGVNHWVIPLSSESFSHNYEKLPDIVIHTCLNTTAKMALLKKRGQQIWLCLFTFQPIALKQLNSLIGICMFSWLSGSEVTLEARGPSFNARLCQGFLCLLYCFVIVVILIFVPKIHYLQEI